MVFWFFVLGIDPVVSTRLNRSFGTLVGRSPLSVDDGERHRETRPKGLDDLIESPVGRMMNIDRDDGFLIDLLRKCCGNDDSRRLDPSRIVENPHRDHGLERLGGCFGCLVFRCYLTLKMSVVCLERLSENRKEIPIDFDAGTVGLGLDFKQSLAPQRNPRPIEELSIGVHGIVWCLV